MSLHTKKKKKRLNIFLAFKFVKNNILNPSFSFFTLALQTKKKKLIQSDPSQVKLSVPS
jgi:hypothetical protein